MNNKAIETSYKRMKNARKSLEKALETDKMLHTMTEKENNVFYDMFTEFEGHPLPGGYDLWICEVMDRLEDDFENTKKEWIGKSARRIENYKEEYEMERYIYEKVCISD